VHRTAIKKLSRLVIRKAAFFLPDARQIEIERRHRGREQLARLAEADCAVVSHGKSGRTWLRVLLSHVYHARCGLPETALLSHDNFHRRNPEVPRVFFTHDNYLRDFTGHTRPIEDYGDHRVVLLVRHPADVTVSQFFQWRFRMKVGKKGLLDYPAHGEEVTLETFLREPRWGLDRVIAFLNLWAHDVPDFPELMLLRYEDLRADTHASLARLLEFLGTPATAAEIDAAVAFGSVENMRRLEQEGGFRGGGRMKPRDPGNPDSFKVRRAKVGGFRDYFDDETVAWIESRIADTLSPLYGYHRPAPLSTAQPAPASTATSG
jgi:hypothetical protein